MIEVIFTLIGLGLVLFLFEIIVPGGFLMIIGAALLLVAAGLAFTFGWGPGLLALVGVIALTASFFALEMRFIRRSKFAQRLVLQDRVVGNTRDASLDTLVGQMATAVTALRPAGQIRVGPRVVEASSTEGHVPAGEKLWVTAADAFRVHVSRRPPAPATGGAPQTQPGAGFTRQG